MAHRIYWYQWGEDRWQRVLPVQPTMLRYELGGRVWSSLEAERIGTASRYLPDPESVIRSRARAAGDPSHPLRSGALL